MSVPNERIFAYRRRVVVEVGPTSDTAGGRAGETAGAGTGADPSAQAPSALELSAEERALLAHILEVYVSDLRMEISATDNPGMRRELRHEEDVLKALLPRLQ